MEEQRRKFFEKFWTHRKFIKSGLTLLDKNLSKKYSKFQHGDENHVREFFCGMRFLSNMFTYSQAKSEKINENSDGRRQFCPTRFLFDKYLSTKELLC